MSQCVYERPTRFLVSGCSFSCSSSSVTDINKNQYMWPDFLVNKHNFEIINNFAISGNGNTAIVQNLSWALTSWSSVFSPEKTLIVFNITGLDRLDLMAPASHPDINHSGSWSSALPFGWITSGGLLGRASGKSQKIIDSLYKNLGWEQIIISNCLNLINFIQRLKTEKYRFYFMLMDDQIVKDSPQFFLDFLESNTDNWIRFDECLSMNAYGKKLDLLMDDNFHLTVQGHKEISEPISTKIINHFT